MVFSHEASDELVCFGSGAEVVWSTVVVFYYSCCMTNPCQTVHISTKQSFMQNPELWLLNLKQIMPKSLPCSTWSRDPVRPCSFVEHAGMMASKRPRSRTPHRVPNVRHLCQQVFSRLNRTACLSLPELTCRDDAWKSASAFVKAVMQNFEWHHRLMGKKCAQASREAEENLSISELDAALARCNVTVADAQELYNRDPPDMQRLADVLESVLSSEEPHKTARMSLLLSVSRFGAHIYERYSEPVQTAEVCELEEPKANKLKTLAGKAWEVLGQLAGGGFDLPRVMPPVFTVKNLEDIRGFVGQDGVYIKHELVRGLNDAEPWRELELFTLLLHEFGHYGNRICHDNLNYHSPLKMKLTDPMRKHAAYGSDEPKGPECGCVAERCAFCCRPKFRDVRRLPAPVQDLLSWLRDRGDRPQFPLDLRRLVKVRADHVSGLDMLDDDGWE